MFHKFDDYTTKTHLAAISCRLDIRHCCRLTNPTEWNQYHNDYFGSASANEYFPVLNSVAQAREALADFCLPETIRQEARRMANELTDAFQLVSKLYRQYDLTSGRLDRRKLAQIARHTASGTYDVNLVRPYELMTRYCPLSP
jgi:hypothetical protein